MANKVFLGGTCNNSTWRDDLIKMLKPDVPYFNPVVKDWTEEAQKEELKQRISSKYCLYVITPKMTGVYSIAEVVDDSCKRPGKTLFMVLEKDDDQEFSNTQFKSLGMVKKMVEENGGTVFATLKDIADFLNKDNRKTIMDVIGG